MGPSVAPDDEAVVAEFAAWHGVVLLCHGGKSALQQGRSVLRRPPLLGSSYSRAGPVALVRAGRAAANAGDSLRQPARHGQTGALGPRWGVGRTRPAVIRRGFAARSRLRGRSPDTGSGGRFGRRDNADLTSSDRTSDDSEMLSKVISNSSGVISTRKFVTVERSPSTSCRDGNAPGA